MSGAKPRIPRVTVTGLLFAGISRPGRKEGKRLQVSVLAAAHGKALSASNLPRSFSSSILFRSYEKRGESSGTMEVYG